MVKLQLLLLPESRTPDGIQEVKRALASLGVATTGQGSVTISAEVNLDQFERLFGLAATDQELPNKDLVVPSALQHHVQSISVAPQHIYMNEPGI